MTISYDTEADALYIEICEGKFASNREAMPGVILDIGSEGELLGIEILDASRRCPLKELAHVDISMPLQLADSPLPAPRS
ncbi:MAG: DUF2283 domain-containing protein [Planctomycetes bacterium]|nr:DUF2283 domain-containing protein [Planctomycetota bacterium]